VLTLKETGRPGMNAYPVPVRRSALCESGFSSTGAVATNATMALGWKPTDVSTAYPLCDPTHHYLLTIRKVGATVTVWKQDVEVGSYTSSATTYAELLAEALTEYAGTTTGYVSRLVIVEAALDYTSFYQASGAVAGLWAPCGPGGPAPHTLLEFTDAASLDANSALRPALSANACSGGSASASSVSGEYTASRAFNGVSGGTTQYPDCWWSTGSAGQWVAYDFGAGNGKEIVSLRFQDYLYGNDRVKNFRVEYSDDGSTWDTAYSGVKANNQTSANPWTHVWFPSVGVHRHWRLYVVDSWSGLVLVQEVEMFEAVVGSTVAPGDWTLAAAQSTDTPTNNGCTLHPLDPATVGTLSDGNLTTTGDAKVTLRPTSGKWYYEKDGVGVSYDADTSGPFDPVLTAGTYNFGATAWNDSGPASDESPLMDAGLPEPAVLDPSEHVLIATFTAPTGERQDLTVGWDAENADWGLRLKNLDAAENWHYISTVAGLGYSNDAYSSASGAPRVALTTPLSVSGNTITIPSDLLTDGGTYAVEVFRVGPEYGFNIVTYTGTGALNTVAHGMGRVPFAVAVMPNDANEHPWVFNTTGTGWNGALSMLLTNAFTVSASVWNNTAPTSTMVTFGTNAAVNAAGNAYQMWVWSDAGVYREIDYTGTGVAGAGAATGDTGGTPEAILFLKDADGAYNWLAHWSMRSPDNPIDKYIRPNVYNAEGTYIALDILSNGFKAIAAQPAGWNTNGHQHVGIAVVHNPKYRNAY
jgi:hypothetical protein